MKARSDLPEATPLLASHPLQPAQDDHEKFSGVLDSSDSLSEADDEEIIEIDQKENLVEIVESESERKLTELKNNLCKSVDGKIISWWHYEDSLFSLLSRKQDLPDTRWRKKKITEAIRWGMGAGLPAMFSTMLVRDIAGYLSHPGLRYDNTLAQILLGTSHHTQTFTSHLGSELIQEGYLGYWYAGLVSLPVFLSGMALLIDAALRKERVLDEETLIQQLHNETPGIIQSLNPWSGFRQWINQAVFAILYNKDIGFEKKYDLLMEIGLFAFDHPDNLMRRPFFAKLYAKMALAEIIVGIEKMLKHALLEEQDAMSDEEIENESMMLELGLKILSNENDIASKYVAWSMGRPHDKKSNLFWIPSLTAASAILYANARYLELIGKEIYKNILHQKEKASCERNNKIYIKSALTTHYECTVCGDWPSIYKGDIKTTQGCLSGLMSQETNATNIIQRMDRLIQQADFKTGLTIDLSKQDWLAWSDEEFTALLGKIKSNAGFVTTLDLSREELTVESPSLNKTKAMVGFIRKVKINNIILKNLGLGDELVQIVMPGINASEAVMLDLSGNQLSAESICSVVSQLPVNSLKTLALEKNLINDGAADCLKAAIEQTQLQSIDLSDNSLGESFIEMLGNVTGRLDEIILDGNDLSEVDPKKLGKVLVNNQQLTKLSMRRTQFSQEQAAEFSDYFKTSNFTELDMSDNPLFDSGGVAIIQGAKNSTLQSIGLSRTELSDQALNAIGRLLPEANIQYLQLNGNPFTSDGINALFSGVKNSTVADIELSDCKLDDQAAKTIASQWGASGLSRISLAGNEIRDEGFCELMNTRPKVMESVSVAKNNLGSKAMECLATTLQGSALKQMDVSQNTIEHVGLTNLSQHIQASNLTILNVADNPVGDAGVLALAESMVTDVPNIHLIGETNPGSDFLRALDRGVIATKLSSLNMRDTGMTAESARAICRIAPHVGMRMNDISLQANNIHPAEVNIASCEIMAGGNPQTNASISKRGLFSSESKSGNTVARSAVQAFAVSAVTAATTTLFVEGLQAKGLPKEQAEYLGMMISATIAYQSGGLLPMLTSVGIQLFCQKVLGASRETALIAGNFASQLVHSAEDMSGWHLANTGIAVLSSFAGSKCGFWLVNKVTTAFGLDKKEQLNRI